MKFQTAQHTFGWLLLTTCLTFCVGLFSCHKDPGKTIFQGYVTEYGTGKPIEGARIYIYCETGPVFGQSQTGLLDSLVTDDKGYFHIEYSNRDICGGVFLTAFMEGYYVNTRVFTHSGLNDLEVVMDPEAWLKIITVPDMGVYHIDISGDYLGAAGFDVYASNGTQEHLFYTTGNRMKHIFWLPWGDLEKVSYDSIFTKGLDTTTYTIHY